MCLCFLCEHSVTSSTHSSSGMVQTESVSHLPESVLKMSLKCGKSTLFDSHDGIFSLSSAAFKLQLSKAKSELFRLYEKIKSCLGVK